VLLLAIAFSKRKTDSMDSELPASEAPAPDPTPEAVVGAAEH